MKRASNSEYALRTAWRLIGIVYVLVSAVVITGTTAKWWARIHEMAWFLFMIGFLLTAAVVFCFTVAAVGWAAWSFRGCTSENRVAASLALSVAVITLIVITGYLLLLTGIIRPFRG
jgi:hypothetical protein